jgi:hypothetical protein
VAAAAVVFGLPAAWWVGHKQPSTPGNPLLNATFTRLTDFEGSELAAEISPDGKFVAFVSDRDGTFDLFVSQIGSGRFSNLTQGRENGVLGPTRSTGISGDGAEVWIRGGPNPNAAPIRFMPLLGGPLHPVVQGVSLSWSADGSRSVFTKIVRGSYFCRRPERLESKTDLHRPPRRGRALPLSRLVARWPMDLLRAWKGGATEKWTLAHFSQWGRAGADDASEQ